VNGGSSLAPLDGLLREEVARLVRRIFLLPAATEASRAVVICGVEQDAGSSRVCARAGVALAQQSGGTVCLVDANLRAPGLHRHFGVESRRGLAEALLGGGPVEEFAQRVAGGRLWLLPGGAATGDASTRLGGERMQECLARLRGRFDRVLIHAPPASQHADAAALGQQADGVVLVVEAGSTRREAARQVKRNLEEAGVRLLGAVLDQRTFPIPEAVYRRL